MTSPFAWVDCTLSGASPDVSRAIAVVTGRHVEELCDAYRAPLPHLEVGSE